MRAKCSFSIGKGGGTSGAVGLRTYSSTQLPVLPCYCHVGGDWHVQLPMVASATTVKLEERNTGGGFTTQTIINAFKILDSNHEGKKPRG